MEFKLKIVFHHYVQLIHVDEVVPTIAYQVIQVLQEDGGAQQMMLYFYKIIRCTRSNSRKYSILSAVGIRLSR